MKYKNKFKLTPDAYKKLITISGELPRLQKLDRNGKPLSMVNTKVYLGRDLPPNVNVPETPKPDKRYLVRAIEPLLVNHAVNLVDIYQQKGWPSVDKYVETCKAIAMRSAEVGEKKEVESVTV
jgi:hypothetical protein